MSLSCSPLLFHLLLVTAIDQYGTRMTCDPDTGEEIKAGEDNDLTQVVVGVVWSDSCLTMTRVGAQRMDSHELYRKNLQAMVDICPEYSTISVFTESAELLREWAQICECAKNGFGDLTADQFPYVWQEIMKQLETKHKKMTMYQGSGAREEYRRAAEMYCEEKVGYFEQVLGQPLDYQGPAKAPWN